MSDPHPASRPTRSRFEERLVAVAALGAPLDTEAEAFDRLVEMLDDPDTAVGADAASALTERGGGGPFEQDDVEAVSTEGESATCSETALTDECSS